MYQKHFGLVAYPFGKDIAHDEMYVSSAMSELATRLAHLVEMSGIGLVTGDSGSGKSSACRAMAAGSKSGSSVPARRSKCATYAAHSSRVRAGRW